MLLVVIGMLVVFYPLSLEKKIAVEDLLGLKKSTIWFSFTKSIWLVFLGSLPVILGVLLIRYPESTIQDWTGLIFIWLLELAGACLLSLAAFAYIQSKSLVAYLKGKRDYRIFGWIVSGVKLVVVGACVLSAFVCAQSIESYQKTTAMKDWAVRQSEDYSMTSVEMNGSEFQDMLNGHSPVQDRLYQMFQILEKDAGAEYIMVSPLNEPSNQIPDKTYMFWVNDNALRNRYASQLDLDLQQPNELESDNTSNIPTAVVYFPKGLTEQEQSKVIDQIELNTDHEAKTIMVPYIDSNQDIDIPNMQIAEGGTISTKNPVLVWMNKPLMDKQSGFLLNSVDTNPIHIPSGANYQQEIEQAVTDAGLTNNNVRFEPLLDSAYKDHLETYQKIMVMYLSISVVCVLLCFLCSMALLMLLQKTQEKVLMVKHLNGFKTLDMYGSEIFYICICWGIGLAVLYILAGHQSFGIIAFILAGIFMALDLLICFLFIRRTENRSLILMLKGEEL